MKQLIFSLTLCLCLVSISSCKKNDNPVGSNATISWNNVLQGTSVSSVCLSGNNLIAGTHSGVIFLSADNGLSWKGVDTLHSVISIKGANFALIPNITVYNDGINLFAGAGNVLEGSVDVSTNNGVNWTERDTSFIQVVNCFASIGQNIFAGTNNGVYISTNDGKTWTAANAGMSYQQVTALTTIDNNLFAGTSGNGVFLSTNNGVSWNSVNNGIVKPPMLTSVYGLASLGTELFASVFHSVLDSTGGVFVSTNYGNNWTPVKTGLVNNTAGILYPDGADLFCGTNIGIFLSTNNGASWSILDSMLVSSFAIDGSNLLVGTGNGIWHISVLK
jgi:hypothetical protein